MPSITKKIALFLIPVLILAYIAFKPTRDYIGGNVLNLPLVPAGIEVTIGPAPDWAANSLLKYLLFSPLFLANDNLTKFEPHLVKNYTISDDGLVYSLTLKENILWSDGTAITGHDFKHSFEKANGAKSSPQALKEVYRKLEKVEVTDTTITIHLNESHNLLLQTLSQFMILPKHVVGDYNHDTFFMSDFWKSPVVSGMFILTDADPNLHVLEINPNFFDKKPQIEKVLLHADPRLTFDLYIANHVASMLNYRSMRGYAEYIIPTHRYRFLAFNVAGKDGNQNPAMQDIMLRRAIVSAIDKKYIIENLYYNFCNVPRASGFITSDELPPFDISIAQNFLAQSNYDLDRPLVIGHHYTEDLSFHFIRQVANQLEAIGFNVDIVQELSLEALLEKRNYDLLFTDSTVLNPIDRMMDFGSEHQFSAIFGGEDIIDDLLRELRQNHTEERYQQIEAKIYETAGNTQYKAPIISLHFATYANTQRLILPKDMSFGSPIASFDFRFEEWEIKKK